MVVEACYEPNSGRFVTKTCDDTSDTKIFQCKSPCVGQKEVVACVSDASSVLGVDTAVAKCAEPKRNEFVTAICTATSETKVQPCATESVGPFLLHALWG